MRVTRSLKAQTELLGFVMVVVIISIAILFIVGFLLRTSQSDVRTDFIDKQLAINLNDAILETSTTCRGIPVRDLLLDCAQEKRLQCDGQLSCDYLSETAIPDLLEITVGASGRNSSFSYRACVQAGRGQRDCFEEDFVGEFQLISVENGDCSSSTVTPGIFPIPTRSGKIVYSVLKICR